MVLQEERGEQMTGVVNCAKHQQWFDYGDACPVCWKEMHEEQPAQCPECRYWITGQHECKPMRSVEDNKPALAIQIGGAHYKAMAIQPVEYILENGIGYCEGNVIKYVSRWRDKGGLEDLRKARHYLDLLIESEEG